MAINNIVITAQPHCDLIIHFKTPEYSNDYVANYKKKPGTMTQMESL